MPTPEVSQQSDFYPAQLPFMRIVSLISAFVLLAASASIAFVTARRMDASRDWTLHTYLVRGLLKDLRSDIGQTHAQFDLYEISGDRREIADLDHQFQYQQMTMSELKRLTLDNDAQEKRLDQLQVLLQQDIDQLHGCLNGQPCLLPRSPDKTGFMGEVSGRRRRMSQMLQDMEKREEDLLRERLQTWERLYYRMVITVVACFALALFLLLYNFDLLFREIKRREKLEEIQKVNAESFRMLSARILELQDVERRRIARDLHDSVGQFLAGLKLNLSRFQRRELDECSDNHALIADTLDLTDRAIVEVRTISHLLHPPLLDELGFHSAARWFAEGFAKRSGVQVELHLAEIVDRLPKEIELALFRVLQESLTNVHRHANATKVDINLICTDEKVILVVCDDGKGLRREILQRFRAGHASGIGLAGMRERLADIGGTLEVDSTTAGTQIRATLPTTECDPTAPRSEDISISPD